MANLIDTARHYGDMADAKFDELNYLASKLDNMSQSEYEQFRAGMEMGDHCRDLQEIINMTENLDCYDIYPDISDYDNLGRYYIEELDAGFVPPLYGTKRRFFNTFPWQQRRRSHRFIRRLRLRCLFPLKLPILHKFCGYNSQIS